MDFLKRLNSKKTLRAVQLALVFVVMMSFGLATLANAISLNERVLIESNQATLKNGKINSGSMLSIPPRTEVTSATAPKNCVQTNKTTKEVGGTGLGDGIFALLIGYTVGLPPTCDSIAQSVGPNGQVLYTYESTVGANQVLANYTAQMIKDPPVSSTEYVAYVIDSFKHPFAQPAYAQGLGFSSLSPVLELWRAMRNLAYFFFVVIFIVIGFMIMFRSKIGGKAAVTVQQALPNIIVSLLLVTFSYAIAGLMIDLMYLLIYLMIGIFTRDIDGLRVADLTKMSFEGNIFSNGLGLFSEGIVGSIAGALGNITVATLGLHPEDIGGQFVQGISNVLFTLVIAIALLVSVFRIFFTLLRAYVGIFFSVIFGPIQLLLGALPGQDTFGSWIKGLFENLLVFPILTLLIILAHFFVKSSFIKQDQLGFSPPQLTSNQGATGYAVFSGLIPLGVILAMPEVLKLAQGAMKGELKLDPAQLQKNLLTGNQYAAPFVGMAGGGLISGGIGAYQNVKKGPQERSPLYNAVSGFFGVGSKQARDSKYSLRKGMFSGFKAGTRVAETIDNFVEGNAINRSFMERRLQEIAREKSSHGKGGEGGDGHGSAPTAPVSES